MRRRPREMTSVDSVQLSAGLARRRTIKVTSMDSGQAESPPMCCYPSQSISG